MTSTNLKQIEAIIRASRERPESADWITFLCWAEAGISICTIPFTSGLSLLGLLGIPFAKALGDCATHTHRAARLAEVQCYIALGEQAPIPQTGRSNSSSNSSGLTNADKPWIDPQVLG